MDATCGFTRPVGRLCRTRVSMYLVRGTTSRGHQLTRSPSIHSAGLRCRIVCIVPRSNRPGGILSIPMEVEKNDKPTRKKSTLMSQIRCGIVGYGQIGRLYESILRDSHRNAG
jgi:lactate dehydrogenase-like 2-hydroxyacid dehydrogenase